MTAAPPPSNKPLSAWSAMVGAGARSLAKVLPLPKSVRDLPPNQRLDALMALAIRNDDEAELISLLRKLNEVHRDHRDRFLAPKALSEAISKKNASYLARLLDAKADPDSFFSPLTPDRAKFNGDRLLHAVVKLGQPTMLRALIDAGARPNLANETGQTALATASKFGHVAMAQILLKNGAHANGTDLFNRLPLNHALAYSCHADPLLPFGGMNSQSSSAQMERLERGALIAKALLNAGSCVINLPSEHNPEGYINHASLPILAGAIRVKDHELIQGLIEHGADTAWLNAPNTPNPSQSQEIQRGWIITLSKHPEFAETIDFAKRLAANHSSVSNALPTATAAPAPVAPESAPPPPPPLAKARSILASRRAAEELRASLSSEPPSAPAP